MSYLGHPIYIEKDKVHKVEIPNIIDRFKLIDSGKRRNTKQLVSYFQENIQEQERERLDRLKKNNTLLIQAILENNRKFVSDLMKEISALQYQVFRAMIVEDIRKFWKNGLEDDSYYIKLCGAGGGGFYLSYNPL